MAPGPRPDRRCATPTAGWSRCPTVEDALAACLDAIRSVQAQRPPNKRFDTNRIMIYVWPPSELHPRGAGDARRSGSCRPPPAPGWRRSCSSPGSATGDRRADRGRRCGSPLDAGRRRAAARRRRRPTEPVQPLDDYRQKVLRAARARQRLPVRADRHAGRAAGQVHRARPRRQRRAGAGRPAARGSNTAAHRRRRGQHADRAAPRGRHPGGAARRPDQVAGRAGRAGVRAGDRRAGPGRADAACRWSGSRCRPARGSR